MNLLVFQSAKSVNTAAKEQDEKKRDQFHPSSEE